MRFVALALIFLSLPVFMHLLKGYVHRRDLAVMAAGLLMFCNGPLDTSASLIAWPAWQGISKGIILSVIDSLAVALIATRPKQMNRPPFTVLVLIFAIPIAISVTQAGVKEAAVFVLLQVFQVFVFYVAISGECQRLSAIRSLLKGIAIGLIVEAGYVIFQKLAGVVQAPGTTAHQNILGIMVELSALPLFAAVLEGERSKLAYGGLLAAIIVIAGGGSRGTMLYFGIGGALLLLISLARRTTGRKMKVVGFSVLACLAALPLGFATLKERFGDTPFTQEEVQRAAFERAARAIAADHPLGVGANNFVSVNNTQGYANRSGLDWAPQLRSKPAHNAYLVSRAETGWAGEASLILLIFGLLFNALRVGFRRRDLPYMGVPLGCAAAIFASALHARYEYAFLQLDIQRLLFTNAAIIAGCMFIGRNNAVKRRSPSDRMRTDDGPSQREAWKNRVEQR